jgi:hypothetical protein
MASEEFGIAVDLAALVGIEGPAAPEALEDTGQVKRSLDRWWAEMADPALDRLFWDAHLPFLKSARNRPLRPLAPHEKKALTQLVNSAEEGGRPTFNEAHKLSLAHAAVFQEILAAKGDRDR